MDMTKYKTAVKPKPPINKAVVGRMDTVMLQNIDPSRTPVSKYIKRQGK